MAGRISGAAPAGNVGGADAGGGGNRPFPRLSVFLARDAPDAVILRRGPTDWAQLIGWDRALDRFDPGQWARARVYERRCDLSPDGRLFVYIAARHGRGEGEAWTALSRPPWFAALSSWPNLGSWYGGGVFAESGRVLLDASCSLEPDPAFATPEVEIGRCPPDSAPWEQRLLRDGWTLVERGFDPRTHRRVGEREVWRKPDGNGSVTLYRQVEDWDPRRFGGPHADTYWLEGDDLIPLDGVRWADWDSPERGGRLLSVVRGEVRASRWSGEGLETTVLYDPGPGEPDAREAPAWARSWRPPRP